MKQNENRNWMVLYTRSRWEKKVDQLLKDQNFESFCPLVKTHRRWVDRNKLIEVPLFQSYLFVQARVHEQSKIMQTSGVINFITQGGKPAVINDAEIDRIRMIVKQYTDVETVSLDHINVGDNVKVVNGPLTNHEGEIARLKGRSVVMIINNINCALTVKIDQAKLSLVG
jgi:transcription antitermination factor NusG